MGAHISHIVGGFFGSSRAPLRFRQCGAVPSLLRPQSFEPLPGSSSPPFHPPTLGTQPLSPSETQTAPPGPEGGSPKPQAFLLSCNIWGPLAPCGFGLALTPRSKSLNPLSLPHGELRGRLRFHREHQRVRSWLCERQAGGKSLGPSLGQARAGVRWGAGLISAGTVLPTVFPSRKPGSEEPGGKPRGKHGLSVLLRRLPSFPQPLTLPGRRPASGPGPL